MTDEQLIEILKNVPDPLDRPKPPHSGCGQGACEACLMEAIADSPLYQNRHRLLALARHGLDAKRDLRLLRREVTNDRLAIEELQRAGSCSTRRHNAMQRAQAAVDAAGAIGGET